MTQPSPATIGSTSSRRPSSEISVQFGPWTRESSSTKGTPSRSASSLPTVVLPLPLALARTATRLTGAARSDARAGRGRALEAGQTADDDREHDGHESVHGKLLSVLRTGRN